MNAVTIVSAEAEQHVPLSPKGEIAAVILDRAEARLAALGPKPEAGLSREP
jgi:hypothetical protein